MQTIKGHWQLIAISTTATLLVTTFYIREWFALGFGLAAGLGMLAMARVLSHQINDLAVIGGCLRYGLGGHSNIPFGRKTDS